MAQRITPDNQSTRKHHESIPLGARIAGGVGIGLITAGILGLSVAGADTFWPNSFTHFIIQDLATLSHQSYSDTWGELGSSWVLWLPGAVGVGIAQNTSSRRNK